MKVLFLSNNDNAKGLYEWISKRCDAEFTDKRINEEYVRSVNPDLIISYNYNYIISKSCIDAVDGRIINMHISYLPWNRGFSPNIWSFIDNTDKGVTIHMLSEKLDEGDILFQRKIDFNPKKETFESTYKKLNDAIVELFIENWSAFQSGEYKTLAKKQRGKGSYHTMADLKKLQETVPFDWSDNVEDFLKRYHKAIKD